MNTMLFRRAALPLVGLVLTCGLFAAAAHAQTFTLDLGPTSASGPNSTTTRVIQLLLLMTVLSIAPALDVFLSLRALLLRLGLRAAV